MEVEAEKVSLVSLRGVVRARVRGVTIEAMEEAIRQEKGFIAP